MGIDPLNTGRDGYGPVGSHRNQATDIVAGKRVESSGGPAQPPPTARSKIAYIGRLYTHCPPGGRDRGVNVPSVLLSMPTVILSGIRVTQ